VEEKVIFSGHFFLVLSFVYHFMGSNVWLLRETRLDTFHQQITSIATQHNVSYFIHYNDISSCVN